MNRRVSRRSWGSAAVLLAGLLSARLSAVGHPGRRGARRGPGRLQRRRLPRRGFIGAAGENNSTGAVWVLPGGTSGPTARGSRVFTAASVNLTQNNGTLLGGNGLLWVI
ncbi:hypothetical protein ACIPSA_23045 [Streptomyces sp. NPDC086549]|uniref:hypothetical protein n=1 Tax=Streptomyces sp. NPDC086549 TaxID=3365752 RepID=UPI003818E5A5